MKATMVWKDGRREPTGSGGGHTLIHVGCGDNGRYVETRFELRLTDDHQPEYHEYSSEDINRRYREGQAKRMVEKAFASGIALPSYILQGMYPGETDEEFRDRIEILRPAVESSRSRGTS